ncbi:MAG: hypothetical protein ACE15C_17640 [Phycisphaerae bacterium]
MKWMPPGGRPWNYKFLAMAFLAGLIVQAAILLAGSLDGRPDWRCALVFTVFDVGIIIRALVARSRGEIGRGWLFYAELCVFFVPLVALVLYVADRFAR